MALTKITTEVIEDGAITSAKLGSGSVSAASLSSITTDNVSEGSTNVYYTDTRARSSVSVTGGNLSYDSGTGVIQLTTDTIRGAISVTDAGGDGSLAYSAGVITYTGPSAAETRAHFSGSTGVSYNSSTGAFTTSAIPNASLSNSSITINSNSVDLGASVTLDTDDIGEGSTNLYYTDARAQGAITVTDAGGDGSLAYSSGTITYTGPSAAETRAHFSAGTGVTLSSGEISIGQDVSTTATPTFGNITTTGYLAGPSTFTIDPAAVGDNTGTVVIAGNFQVDGTTTTVNSTTVTVDDKLLTLASGSINAAAANGGGIEIDITGSTNPSILYDGTNDEWDFNKDISVTGNIVVSGTVDGRDIATDGTKLDGIESGATADQTQSDINALAITQVGTISSGTWQGTAIASAYLDSDTAHLSGAQTFTGTKTFATSEAASVPLKLGSSSQTGYTRFDMITDTLDSTPKAYLIAYGSSNGEDGNFAMKNNHTGGEIFFEFSANKALVLNTTTSTFGTDVDLTSGHVYKVNGTTVIDSSKNLTNIGTISSGVITTTAPEFRYISNTDSNVGLLIRDETYVSDEADITASRLASGNNLTLGLAGQVGINAYIGGVNKFSINSGGNATFAGRITANDDLILQSDVDLHLIATNPNAGSSFQYGEITFGDSTSNQFINHAKIISSGNYANQSNLEFHTSNNNSSPLRMKIDPNGDISFYEDTGTTAKLFWDASAESLGIGTSSPVKQLTLAVADTSTVVATALNHGASNYWGIGSYTDQSFRIAKSHGLEDANTYFAIDRSNGNVAIGATSAFDNKLEVNGGDIRVRGTSTPSLKLNNGDQEVIGIRLKSGASGVLSFHTDKMIIDTSGNVGIGTSTAPGANGGGLAIYKSDYPRITLRNSTSGDTTSDGFQAALVGSDMQWDLAESGNQKFFIGGTEYMRLNSLGQLCIGDASYFPTSGTNVFYMRKDSTSTQFLSHYNLQGGLVSRYYGDYGNDGTIAELQIKVGDDGNEAKIQTWSNSVLKFGTNNTYAMEVGTNQSLYVGGTQQGADINDGRIFAYINSTNVPACRFAQGSTSTGIPVMRIRHENSSNGNYIEFRTDENVLTGKIYDSSGTMQYTSQSDQRLKENIEPMPEGLTEVLAMNPVKYTLKDIVTENKTIPMDGAENRGFLAQELNEQYPWAVEEGGEDVNMNPWGVDYGKLTPILVKAIQELNTKLEAAEARITELEG